MNFYDYYSAEGNLIRVSAEQGSHFAKSCANDFNPLHDPQNKRFCVPGDLLFALVLHRFGVSEQMAFSFSSMVAADTALLFPKNLGDDFEIIRDRNKSCLQVQRSGENHQDQAAIAQLVSQYVSFSGQNFPHILVPLMAQHNVMINPARPLVMYEGMTFELDSLEFKAPVLSLSQAVLDVDGKRGDVRFEFSIEDSGHTIGHGIKKLVLGGLRPFEQNVMDVVVNDYITRRAAYNAS